MEKKSFHLFTVTVICLPPSRIGMGKGTALPCLQTRWLKGGEVTVNCREAAGCA